MRTQTLHANVPQKAIGYVRVSTQEQAPEGVSLDAQRDRLRSYSRLNGIKLIDIISDEGISGSTLDRPGLQAALHLIKRGCANTLTRSSTQLFVDINTKHMGVPKALILDVKSLAGSESEEEKLLRELFDRLNADAESPLEAKTNEYRPRTTAVRIHAAARMRPFRWCPPAGGLGLHNANPDSQSDS